MISTKGRYALRVLIDLAQHPGGLVPMKEVAARQGISLKYLEKILPALTREKLLEGTHGKGGGYRLTKPPGDYTVWEILTCAEGDLAPVSCLEQGAAPCPRAVGCRTLPMWREFFENMKGYFSGITLRDLVQQELPMDFVI